MSNIARRLFQAAAAKAGALFLALSLVASLLQPAVLAEAQTVSYSPVTLTSASNITLNVQIQALNFAGSKWNYQVNWQRTLDKQGSIYVSPKLDKTALVPATVNNNSISRIGNMTVSLNPGTRYRIEFYSDVSAGGKLLLRKFFNTLDANGNPIPDNMAIGGTDANGNLITSINSTTGAVTTVNPNTNQTATVTPTPTPTPASGQCGTNASGVTVPCPTDPNKNPTAQIMMRARDNSNYPTGLRGAPEPLVVLWNPNIDSLGKVTVGNPEITGPEGQGFGISSLAASIVGPQNINNHIVENGSREIWAFGTVGRPFTMDISYINYGLKCNDANLVITRNVGSLPPGISYKQNCVQTDPPTINVDGTVSGVASSAGTYLAEFLTTRQTPSGPVTGKTRFRFIILKTNQFGVDLTDANGASTASPSLASRANIRWDQTNNLVGASIYDKLDIWVAPAAGNAGKYPDLVTNKLLVARGVGGNFQGCNNSTSGGADALRYGCGNYNWLVGNTLGGNLAPGQYIIYVVPYMPVQDDEGAVIGQMYMNCGAVKDPLNSGKAISDSNCFGYTYGMKPITIGAAVNGNTLPSDTPGNYVETALLSGGVSYTRKNSAGQTISSGSIGQGKGSNTDQAACSGNDSGGTTCGITVYANPGDMMDFSWKSVDQQGRPAGTAWTSTMALSGYNPTNASDVTSFKNCTSGIVPGGLSINDSEGFLSSQSGSKTITIPSCPTAYSIAITYNTYFYGCANLGGSNNFEASSNPSLLLQNGNSTCQLSVYMGSAIYLNVGLSQTVGEFTNNSCRLPAQLSGVSCTKVSSSSYQANFGALNSNAMPDTLSFYAGESQAEVNNNCPTPTSCLTPNGQVRQTFSSANPNLPFTVTGSAPGKTYYNKLVAQCGTGGDAETRQVTWSCTTDSSGNITGSPSGDWSNTSSCVLPSDSDIYGEVNPNFFTGVDVTGNDLGYLNDTAITSYMATFSDLRYSGAKFDKLTFMVDTDKSKVDAGCTSGCKISRDVNLAYPANNAGNSYTQNPNKFNEQYVDGLTPNTTYYNKLTYWCGSNHRDVSWTASTEGSGATY